MDHDHSYKLLFSHPEMVADLIRGFVREEWVQHLDFTSLEKVSGSYVADDLREREDDVIWRLRWGSDWLYVYLLIEFQSTVDRYMAARVLAYLGLLYQDLVRRGQLSSEGQLPPVLPIVLYNGNRRWDAPVEIADLVVPIPKGLAAYCPRLKYLLLDEGSYADSELEPLRNLAAALFRLENSRTPRDVERVVAALVGWLEAPEQTSLRRAHRLAEAGVLAWPDAGSRIRRHQRLARGSEHVGGTGHRVDTAMGEARPRKRAAARTPGRAPGR
jgi:hypothetical protein